MNELKVCSVCKEEKRVEDFHFRSSARTHRFAHCKKCANAKIRKWERENPEKAALKYRRKRLKKKYGLTLEDYNSMQEAQNNRCAICETSVDYDLKVDHCHTTGKTRSLLCHPCNVLLGFAREDVDILQKAIDYLGKWGNE